MADLIRSGEAFEKVLLPIAAEEHFQVAICNELARRAGRTATAIYKRLHRIRMALVDCTRAVMRKEGWT
jgi:hypothetical protein